jgi:hypothetical protein
VGIWILAAGLLGLALAGCQIHFGPVAPEVISADRTIVHLPDGRYAVTETWLLERYELERTLRLQVERCEQEQEEAEKPVLQWHLEAGGHP